MLLRWTSLGIYAIAGTSSVVLGFTHGVIVPGCAARLLDKPVWLFWKIEVRSWFTLGMISILFAGMINVMQFSGWGLFFINIVVAAVIGYPVSFLLVFNRTEKREMKNWLSEKIRLHKKK